MFTELIEQEANVGGSVGLPVSTDDVRLSPALSPFGESLTVKLSSLGTVIDGKLSKGGSASDVSFTPYGATEATTVQSALEELTLEKASVFDIAALNSAVNAKASQASVDALTIAIAGKANSADIGWTYGSLLMLPAANGANYTGIDVNANEIEIFLNAVSPNTSGFLYLGLIDSTGTLISTSVHYSAVSKFQNSVAVATIGYSATTSLILAQPLVAGNFVAGSVRLNKMPGVGWVMGSKLHDAGGYNFEASGIAVLGASVGLTGVRLALGSGVNFDAGGAMVRWRK